MITHENIFISRFAVLVATLLGLLCFAPTSAYAAKVGVAVTPANLEAYGFSMRMEKQEDGMVAVTLIRDLSKAKAFPVESGLQLWRYATLRVGGQTGLLAQCDIAPSTRNQKGTMTYQFTLSRECLAHSRLMVVEDHDFQDQTQEHLIGGGTHYEFDLALFAKP